MTFEELQAETHALHERLAERTGDSAVHMTIASVLGFAVSLFGGRGLVGQAGVMHFHNDDPAKAIKSAYAYIATLPDTDQRALTRYRNNLASTLDAAKDDGVEDKFLAGARQSMTAVSEALLPAPERSDADQ